MIEPWAENTATGHGEFGGMQSSRSKKGLGLPNAGSVTKKKGEIGSIEGTMVDLEEHSAPAEVAMRDAGGKRCRWRFVLWAC